MPSFNDFSLLPTTRTVLANMEFTEPTPIQVEAIPALLAGNDFIGQSITGSGKTLAYGIPLVELETSTRSLTMSCPNRASCLRTASAARAVWESRARLLRCSPH